MVKYFSFFSISISSSVFFPFFLCFSRWSVPIKWLTKNLQFFYLFISPLTSSIFLFSLFPLFLTSFEKYFCNSCNFYLFVLLCSSTFPSSFPIAKNKKRTKESISLILSIFVYMCIYLPILSPIPFPLSVFWTSNQSSQNQWLQESVQPSRLHMTQRTAQYTDPVMCCWHHGNVAYKTGITGDVSCVAAIIVG